MPHVFASTSNAWRRRSARRPGQGFSDAVNRLKQILTRESIQQSLTYIGSNESPPVAENRTSDEQIQAVAKEIAARKTEAQTLTQVLAISTDRIEKVLEQAEGNAAAFDTVCTPITNDTRTLEKAVAEIGAEMRKRRDDGGQPIDKAAALLKDMAAGLRAAKEDFTARRYAKEAAYNQESAELLEIRVRRTGAESDRHRTRSKNSFTPCSAPKPA